MSGSPDIGEVALELLLRVTYALDIVDRVKSGALTEEKALATLDAAVVLLKSMGEPDAAPIVDFPFSDAELAMFRGRIDNARDRVAETFGLLLAEDGG